MDTQKLFSVKVSEVRGRRVRGLDLENTVLPAAQLSKAMGLTDISDVSLAVPLIRPRDEDGNLVLRKDGKALANRRPNREVSSFAGHMISVMEEEIQVETAKAVKRGGEALATAIESQKVTQASLRERILAQDDKDVAAAKLMLAAGAVAGVN